MSSGIIFIIAIPSMSPLLANVTNWCEDVGQCLTKAGGGYGKIAAQARQCALRIQVLIVISSVQRQARRRSSSGFHASEVEGG
jgi:hypothetical protein